ncbi:3-hydroxyisobutyrate dehydrogenase-like beta-hydroxyacid dehydrogenase [Rhodoligotrophos appendicifer]
MKVGFIGVGLMGQGMAENLIRCGHRLTVLAHRNRAPIESLMQLGASEAETAAKLAEDSEVIFLCLPNSKVVEDIIGTLRPLLKKDALIIDTSTAEPSATQRLQADLAASGIGLVDAPVAGGPKQARDGELGAMVGGAPADVQRAVPLLECFCREVSVFGGPGTGNTAKLMSNYLVLGMVALITETFQHARAADIDWQKLYAVMLCGSGNSGALRRIMDAAVEGDLDGYPFSIANAAKDSAYVMSMLRTMQRTTPLAEAVNQVYVRAQSAGDPQRFVSRLMAESSLIE